MENVVYLVHKLRGGKPIEVKAEVYNAQPMTFSKDGWRKMKDEEVLASGILTLDQIKAGIEAKMYTVEQVRKAGYEIQEVKPPPPKKTRKKKTSPKED